MNHRHYPSGYLQCAMKYPHLFWRINDPLLIEAAMRLGEQFPHLRPRVRDYIVSQFSPDLADHKDAWERLGVSTQELIYDAAAEAAEAAIAAEAAEAAAAAAALQTPPQTPTQTLTQTPPQVPPPQAPPATKTPPALLPRKRLRKPKHPKRS